MAIKKADLNGSATIDAKLAAITSQKKDDSLAGRAKAKANANAQAQAILKSATTTDAQKKKANDILNPKKQSFLSSGLGKLANSPVGKGAMGLLDVADTARAAVVSGLSETSDLLTDAFNLPGHEYVDASFDDLVKQTRDNIGMGTAFREKAAASAAAGDNKVFGIKTFKNPEALANAPKGGKAFKEFLKAEEGGKKAKYTKGGKALGLGTGLVGDIALDPLTYVTMGGSRIAGASADAVADAALKAGRAEIAQKAATQGKWALTAKELEAIGLAGEGGIHFRVPGTGAIGRNTINRGLEGEIRTGAIKGTENAMKHTPVGLYQSARAKSRTQIAERSLSAAFGGKFNTLKDAMYTGTPEQFKNAFGTIQADRVAVGWEKTFDNDISRQWSSLEARMSKLGIDGTDAYRALGDPENIGDEAKRILSTEGGIEFLGDLRMFASDTLPKTLNEHAGQQVLKNVREGWQPSLRPKETRDWLIETYGERGGRLGRTPLSSGDIPAEIIAGGEFMGERLVSVADSQALYGKALTPREQAHEILVQKMATLGEDKVLAMFDEDIITAMPAAIRNNANRVYRSRMELELIDRGVATKLTRVVNDPTAVVSVGVRAQINKRLSDMRLTLAATKAEAEDAATLAARIDQRAKVARNVVASKDARRARTLGTVVSAAKVAAAPELSAARVAAESVERLSKLLPDISAGTRELSVALRSDLGHISSPEYIKAAAAFDAARSEMDKVQESMGKLLRKREALLAKAESTPRKIEVAEQIRQLEANLSDLGAFKVKALTEQFPNLADDLVEFTARADDLKNAKGLAMKLTAAEAAGDEAAVGALQAQLANLLGAEFAQRSGTEMLADVVATQSTLNDHLSVLREAAQTVEQTLGNSPQIPEQFARLTALSEEALQLGDAETARKLVELQAAMPTVDGAALINPAHPEGMWALGDVSRLDASSLGGWRAGAAATENGLGVRLVQNGAEGTADVVVKVSNPKVYGVERALDLAYADRQFAAYGTNAPNSIRMLRNDMLKHGFDNGTLTLKTLPGDTKRWWQFFKARAEGASAEEAAVKAFGDSEAIGLAGRAYDAQGISDGQWILSRLGDDLLGDDGLLQGDLKTKLSASFSDDLSKTHDAIVLPGKDGEWQVIALRPEVLHSAEGEVVKGVTTMHDAATSLRNEVYRQADGARAAADEVGTDLDVMLGKYHDMEKRYIASSARKTELEAELTKATKGALGEKMHFEYELRGEVERLATAVSGHRSEAARIRKSALGIADALGKQKAADEAMIEDLLAQAAEAKAAHKSLEADLVRKAKSVDNYQRNLEKYEGKVARTLERNIALTGDATKTVVRDELTASMAHAMRQLSQDVYAPNNVVAAIVDMQRVFGHPDGAAGALRAYDKVTNIWKAQAMTRPGFHMRNFMGGAINNWMANVESTAYKAFHDRFTLYRNAVQDGTAHVDAIDAVAKKFGQEDALKLQSIIEMGVATGGQSSETRLVGAMHASNYKPWSSDFKLYRSNGKAMEAVENRLRGAMAWDRLTKGMSPDAMLADVARYHFDYDDLSRFERGFVRRIVPFYTWTRKNFPLQIEMMLENPKAMLRFSTFKRNIEAMSEDDAETPNWFNNELQIRTPFKAGGGNIHLFPDAPFKDLTGAATPSKWLEQVNPLIKTPLEQRAGKRFFGDIPFKEGYQDVPTVWETLGIPDVMAKFGKAERAADGSWKMRDKDLYLVEQWVPFLGQAVRLVPSGGTQTQQDRVKYSWAAFMLGVTARQNDAQAQKSEYTRRAFELQDLKKDLETTGFLDTKKKATPA